MMRTRQRTEQLTPNIETADRKGLSGILQEVDPLLDAPEPLDVQEQQRVIQLFEDAQLREARTWKVQSVPVPFYPGEGAPVLCTPGANLQLVTKIM